MFRVGKKTKTTEQNVTKGVLGYTMTPECYLIGEQRELNNVTWLTSSPPPLGGSKQTEAAQ